MLSPDDEKHIQSKVNEYLNEFRAQLQMPPEHKQYALIYAIEILAREIEHHSEAPQEMKTSFEAMQEWLAVVNKPSTPKTERALIFGHMKKLNNKR